MANLSSLYNGPATRVLPNGGGSYQAPVGPQFSPAGGVGTVYGEYTYGNSGWLKTPIATQNRITPPPAVQQPVTPTAVSKYINPATGGYYTPQEYANSVASKIPASKNMGDIAKTAGDALMNPDQSVGQLQKTGTNLNNARNDIATGATDPYKVGAQSGIAYSPTELSAIEKAYAGIYDPALNDVFVRLKAKQDEEDAARAEASKLALMDKQHQYDLELKQTPSYSDSHPANTGDYNLSSKQQTQLLNITNKYSADQTVNQGLGAVQIKNITKAINADPASAGNQLIALYTLVKNLDPDSAVREGELTLASKTNSYLGKFQDSLTRISTGRVLNPVALRELTAATDLLADEWVSAAQRRQKQYSSQASVFGLDEPFNDYIGGFENPDTMSSNELPPTMVLNGVTLQLQADGTYE